MLRAGGLVIVIRHGATNDDQADTDPLNPDNVAKQRRLSAKGEAAAEALGHIQTDWGPRRCAFALRALVGTAPAAGTNTVIVTHKPNVIDAFGKNWFEVKEGETTIFRPAPPGFQVVAHFQIDEWPRIAAAAKR